MDVICTNASPGHHIIFHTPGRSRMLSPPPLFSLTTPSPFIYSAHLPGYLLLSSFPLLFFFCLLSLSIFLSLSHTLLSSVSSLPPPFLSPVYLSGFLISAYLLLLVLLPFILLPLPGFLSSLSLFLLSFLHLLFLLPSVIRLSLRSLSLPPTHLSRFLFVISSPLSRFSYSPIPPSLF